MNFLRTFADKWRKGAGHVMLGRNYIRFGLFHRFCRAIDQTMLELLVSR